MGKVSYANMKLKVKNEVKTFKFQDNDIEVIQYLPVEDKNSLIGATLNKAKEGSLYNPLKLDMYFHLHLIYVYTNLSFTDKQRENEEKIYDALKINGFIDEVLMYIPESEYNDLMQFMNESIENEMKYTTTAASVVNKLINDLPSNAQAAANIVDNFDKTKFQEVINFAKSVNNGKAV